MRIGSKPYNYRSKNDVYKTETELCKRYCMIFYQSNKKSELLMGRSGLLVFMVNATYNVVNIVRVTVCW